MSEYDDSHMLSKTLERIAAQAMHLKEKIDAGLELPSWAEYKVYSAYEGIGKALGTSYPGEYEDDEDDEKMAAAFTPALNNHPALKGGQSRLPDKIQGGIIKKKLQMKTAAAKTDQQNRGKDLRDAAIAAGSLSGSGMLAKPTASNNSLKKWTKQDWNWTGGDKPGEGGRGIYLPEQKADRLRKTEDGKDQLAAAARKKNKATREGKQYSSHGLAANTSLRSKR